MTTVHLSMPPIKIHLVGIEMIRKWSLCVENSLIRCVAVCFFGCDRYVAVKFTENSGFGIFSQRKAFYISLNKRIAAAKRFVHHCVKGGDLCSAASQFVKTSQFGWSGFVKTSQSGWWGFVKTSLLGAKLANYDKSPGMFFFVRFEEEINILFVLDTA